MRRGGGDWRGETRKKMSTPYSSIFLLPSPLHSFTLHSLSFTLSLIHPLLLFYLSVALCVFCPPSLSFFLPSPPHSLTPFLPLPNRYYCWCGIACVLPSLPPSVLSSFPLNPPSSYLPSLPPPYPPSLLSSLPLTIPLLPLILPPSLSSSLPHTLPLSLPRAHMHTHAQTPSLPHTHTHITGGVALRVFCPPGRAAQGAFALDAGVRALDFYDDFFQVRHFFCPVLLLCFILCYIIMYIIMFCYVVWIYIILF